MAKIYIRFELIGSGNLDYRNIVSARLVKETAIRHTVNLKRLSF